MLQRPRLSRILYRRAFFPYPIGITFSVARRLGLVNTALIGLSYIKARLFPCKDETYLDAFFINRFGRRLYETFFKDYTEKVWGVPCGQIRGGVGKQRIMGLSLKRAVGMPFVIFAGKCRSSPRGARNQSDYPVLIRSTAPGHMWETVARHIEVCGGELRLRTRVAGVQLRDGRVVSVTVESLHWGRTRRYRVRRVFFNDALEATDRHDLAPIRQPPSLRWQRAFSIAIS